MPKNLKKNLSVKDLKLTFKKDKAVLFAWGLTEEYTLLQEELIMETWGDSLGSNSIEDDATQEFINKHKDCPHIREEFRVRTGGENGKEKE